MSLQDEPIPYNPTSGACSGTVPGVVERRRDYQSINATISEAVDRSTRKVFTILGVDLDDPESVEEFRQDLRFSRRVRQVCEKGTAAIVVAMLSAIGYAIVEIVQTSWRK